MPGPSSGVPTNSMPAASKAAWTLCRFLAEIGGTPSLSSNLLIVLTLIAAAVARSWTVHRSPVRAARTCAPVNIDITTK